MVTRRDSQVLVFSREGSFLRSFGLGLFSARPHSITLGKDGSVWCVDETRHTVLRFDRQGKLLGHLGEPDVPSDSGFDARLTTLGERVASISRGVGPFNLPTKVAVGPESDLFVTDGYGNSRIHHFSRDGQLLASWGEPGSGRGEFHVPHHIVATEDRRLLVCDRENERIQIFTFEGRYIGEWGGLQRPAALAISRDGLIFVAELPWRAGDRSFHRGILTTGEPACVTVLDAGGKRLERWMDDDPCSEGGFTAPHGVAFDSLGNLYVAEVTWSFGVRLGLVPDNCPTLRKFTLG
jgi:sugar lactone lactonase YvrE